jgi:acyl carrier protein
VGVAGEIHIGGVVLARGYLNRPELTAKKFIPDPFADEPGARLYRTGDLARYLPGGNIEFLGRIDHQVKIRGFRIELGEIEVVLGQHPAVREAVALVREDMPGDKRLIAYVALKAGSSSSTGELRRFLTAKLPAYMVPSTFVMLESLPLSANGKIDRCALPAPDHARPELEETFVAPCTHVEKALAGIWTDLLNLEEVGVHDNFFRLGGHSLLATQIISRVCRTFGINISLRVFFETPTISALSAFIDALHWQIKNRESGREAMDYLEGGEI